MGGFEDHVAITGDWMVPSPIPRSLFSSVMADDMVAGSHGEQPVLESKNPSLFSESEGRIASGVTCGKEAAIANMKADCEMESSPCSVSRGGSRGNLVERMAVRAGFNAPRLNTESIRPLDVPKGANGQPLFVIAIPPGLSPTSLLESPVFLNNSQVMPSPTTGKFCFAPCGNSRIPSPVMDSGKDNSLHDGSPLTFKPVAESGSFALQPLPGAVQTKSGGDEIMDPNSRLLDEPYENGEQSSGDASGCPTDDGYSWRKYGQKQVKGSEYPRSYYKCTYANCPVKKKVERSHEGHITEIIYNGMHNHSKSTAPSDMNQLGPDPRVSGVKTDPAWSVKQPLSQDNLEATSLVWIPQEYSNGTHFDLGDGSSNEEAHGSICCDGEEDESESKRRRLETYTAEMNGVTRAIREPRVVVQTTSEVDILDDGYRWRKYGQKVVKGNPNPRSYYKCTSPGCNVRKHVERASHDLKSVITTYEGKHNHEVPAAKNGSSHTNSTAPAPSHHHIHRSESSQVQHAANTAHFRRPAAAAYGGFGLVPPPVPPLQHPLRYSGHQVSLMVPKLEPLTADASGGLQSCDGSSSIMFPPQFMRG